VVGLPSRAERQRLGGDVWVVVVVPEFVGKGFGGHLLTLGTHLAWEAKHPDGTHTRRVRTRRHQLDRACSRGPILRSRRVATEAAGRPDDQAPSDEGWVGKASPLPSG
jgi:GNAT superfamily N-acetyltransferase